MGPESRRLRRSPATISRICSSLSSETSYRTNRQVHLRSRADHRDYGGADDDHRLSRFGPTITLPFSDPSRSSSRVSISRCCMFGITSVGVYGIAPRDVIEQQIQSDGRAAAPRRNDLLRALARFRRGVVLMSERSPSINCDAGGWFGPTGTSSTSRSALSSN